MPPHAHCGVFPSSWPLSHQLLFSAAGLGLSVLPQETFLTFRPIPLLTLLHAPEHPSPHCAAVTACVKVSSARLSTWGQGAISAWSQLFLIAEQRSNRGSPQEGLGGWHGAMPPLSAGPPCSSHILTGSAVAFAEKGCSVTQTTQENLLIPASPFRLQRSHPEGPGKVPQPHSFQRQS